jgi:hypothetical protein
MCKLHYCHNAKTTQLKVEKLSQNIFEVISRAYVLNLFTAVSYAFSC